MSKHFLYICCFLFSSYISAQSCLVESTNKITVSENYSLIKKSSDFSTGSSKGKVVQKLSSWGTRYDIFQDGKRMGYAKKSIASWGTEIKFYDCKDQYIGMLKENVMDNIFSIKTTYYVYDENNIEIAKSKKISLMGAKIELFDTSGRLICKITRPTKIMTWLDKWKIDIKKDIIDKRILILIPVYKTHADKD